MKTKLGRVALAVIVVFGMSAMTTGCVLVQGKNYNFEIQAGLGIYVDIVVHQGESEALAKIAFSKGFDPRQTGDALVNFHLDGWGAAEWIDIWVRNYRLTVEATQALWDIAYWAQFSPVDCFWFNFLVGGNNNMIDVGWKPDGDGRCRWSSL
jgi:hypothetical protein